MKDIIQNIDNDRYKKNITCHKNGNKMEEVYKKNGKMEGEWTSWYDDGTKELVSYWEKGKPCNIWMYWDKDGNYDFLNMD